MKDAIDYAKNPDKTTESKYLDDDLYRALSYTQNDQKTDQKMYVSAINCPKQQAYEAMMDTKRRYGKLGGNVAYHGFQSFKPGEVTPEEAHRIGIETAKKMWGEDYEIVVTTHLNTDKLHNHMVLNSVSFKTGRKFENHISDHYRLREISDAVCREYGKSVMKNAAFYGGEKGSYWVHKNGGMTHRDMLRRDVDEVLSKVSTYQDFIEYLENLGYELRGDIDSPNLSVIAEGWQRPVRLKSLGESYTPDAIYDRIVENQRKPELYWITIPARRRTPLSFLERYYRDVKRVQSLGLLFFLFLELLKICTGSNLEETDNRPLSPQMRAELRKLDQYTEDTQLLCEHHINTEEDLSVFRDGIRQQIHELEQQRRGIYNKIRRATEPEKPQLKEQARAISQQIAPLRKKLRCADRIWERSMNKVRTLLEQEKKMEAQVMHRHKERGYAR